MSEGENPLRLEPGALERYGSWAEPHEAPRESGVFIATVDIDAVTAERAAILLLAEVYLWFGFEEDRIPYTTGEGENRVVDVEAIVNVSRS